MSSATTFTVSIVERPSPQGDLLSGWIASLRRRNLPRQDELSAHLNTNQPALDKEPRLVDSHRHTSRYLTTIFFPRRAKRLPRTFRRIRIIDIPIRTTPNNPKARSFGRDNRITRRGHTSRNLSFIFSPCWAERLPRAFRRIRIIDIPIRTTPNNP